MILSSREKGKFFYFFLMLLEFLPEARGGFAGGGGLLSDPLLLGLLALCFEEHNEVQPRWDPGTFNLDLPSL